MQQLVLHEQGAGRQANVVVAACCWGMGLGIECSSSIRAAPNIEHNARLTSGKCLTLLRPPSASAAPCQAPSQTSPQTRAPSTEAL